MDDNVRPIGEILPAVIAAPAPGRTDSAQRSISALQRLDLSNPPERLNDTMLAKMEVMATCRLPALPACDEGHFFEQMTVLSASLPRRAADEISGLVQAETYWQMLKDQPAAAIDYLVAEALRRCQWFPTIAECLAIIRERRWEHPLARKQTAVAQLISREKQLRFDDAMLALACGELDQEQIDALPERWKRIAAEKCFLWWHSDGSFTARIKPAEVRYG